MSGGCEGWDKRSGTKQIEAEPKQVRAIYLITDVHCCSNVVFGMGGHYSEGGGL